MSQSQTNIPPNAIVSSNYHVEGKSVFDNGVDQNFTWEWGSILLSITLTLITLGTIFGNLFVLIHFTKSLRRRGLHNTTPTHFFIANLALADFLVGILVLPALASFQVTDKWYFGQCLCTIWVCTHFWLCAASILSTCAICIERYIGVKYPIQHMRILNPKRIGVALGTVWLLAGIPSLVRVFAWTEPRMDIPYKCTINQKIGHAILAAGGIFYLPASIMVILYFRIYQIAMRHMTSLKTGLGGGGGRDRGLQYHVSIGGGGSSSGSGSTTFHKSSLTPQEEDGDKATIVNVESSENAVSAPPVSPKNDSQRHHPRPKTSQSIEQRQINLARKLAILVGVVLISYGPYFTLILLKSINPLWINPVAFDCFAWIRYFNSFLNPFIYAYAVPAFNTAFRKSFSSMTRTLTISARRN